MEYPYLHILLENEDKAQLYFNLIDNFPFWRIVRNQTRFKYLAKKDFKSSSYSYNRSLLYFLLSLMQSIKDLCIIIFNRKNIENIFFSFQRLNLINGSYLDKFTDPIIDLNRIWDYTYIFQYNCGKKHTPRYNRKCVKYVDICEVISYVVSFLTLPLCFIVYFNTVCKTFISAKNVYDLNKLDLFLYFLYLSQFKSKYYIYYYLLKIITPKRIFVLSRNNLLPQILAAKKLNIKVYELQHGVTHSETPLYSGNYSELLEPDLFLTFGTAWIGEQFAMPLSKVKNMGWAYKDFAKNIFSHQNNNTNNGVLIISSPEISSIILEVSLELALLYPNVDFYIRLHPHELYTSEMLSLIDKRKNIYIQDNKIESIISLLSFTYVLGENSSVLYEALSLGKVVGRFSYHGLTPLNDNNNDFIYLNSPLDFSLFYKIKVNDACKKENAYYSDFDYKLFNSL